MECKYEAHTANEEFRVFAENAKLRRVMKEMERQHDKEVEELQKQLDEYRQLSEKWTKVAARFTRYTLELMRDKSKLEAALVEAEQEATKWHTAYLKLLHKAQ